jgi:hypothetical protein
MEKAAFEYERNVVHADLLTSSSASRLLALNAEVYGTSGDIKLDFRVKETGTPVRLCRLR